MATIGSYASACCDLELQLTEKSYQYINEPKYICDQIAQNSLNWFLGYGVH